MSWLRGLLPELGCQKLFDVGEGILNGFGQNTQTGDKGGTRRRRIEKWSESDLVDSSPAASLTISHNHTASLVASLPGTKQGTKFKHFLSSESEISGRPVARTEFKMGHLRMFRPTEGDRGEEFDGKRHTAVIKEHQGALPVSRLCPE